MSHRISITVHDKRLGRGEHEIALSPALSTDRKRDFLADRASRGRDDFKPTKAEVNRAIKYELIQRRRGN